MRRFISPMLIASVLLSAGTAGQAADEAEMKVVLGGDDMEVASPAPMIH